MEAKRGLGVCEKLLALGAFGIAVKYEAARVQAFQKHDAHIRHAGSIDGCQRHRVGIVDLGALRLVEPSAEERLRLGGLREVFIGFGVHVEKPA